VWLGIRFTVLYLVDTFCTSLSLSQHLGEKLMDRSLLEEFRLDWNLDGNATQTAINYIDALNKLFDMFTEPTLANFPRGTRARYR